MKVIFIISVLNLIFNIVRSQEEFPGCKGKTNESELLHLDYKLVSEVNNGQKYIMQKDDNLVIFANITGNAYEMGYAQGKLLKEEIQGNAESLGVFVEQFFAEYLEEIGVPQFLVQVVAKSVYGLFSVLLKLNYFIAEKYIPERFIQEMQGISDASGIPFSTIRDFNMLPELIKAACTIAGTWSKATVDEKLLTLRALDWQSTAPVNRYPTIVVYHSTEEGSYPFANVGYAGLIGSITAVGSQGVSISEKVWIPRYDPENYPTTYFGKPWTFVLRDLAQFETTLQGMADTLYNTDRTCRIHIGIASAQDRGFEGVNYSWQVLQFFNDRNYTDYNEDSHPELEGVMFFNKNIQPSTNPCVGRVLNKYWGNITQDTLYRKVAGLSQTGNTQLCVADVYDNSIWLSYSSYETGIPAYERSPMFIDLKPFYGL